MTIDKRAEQLALTIALGLPCATAIALMMLAPGRVAPGAYVVVVALLLGLVSVAVNTWRAAQASGSIGQLIYETNTGLRPDGGRTRWDRWVNKYDRSAAR